MNSSEYSQGQSSFSQDNNVCIAPFPLDLGAGVSVSVGPLSNTRSVETKLLSRRLAVWCAILSGLIVLLYASVLRNLVVQWWTDPDYSYGFFIPLFSGYILW